MPYLHCNHGLRPNGSHFKSHPTVTASGIVG
jgi:hypothetical protein